MTLLGGLLIVLTLEIYYTNEESVYQILLKKHTSKTQNGRSTNWYYSILGSTYFLHLWGQDIFSKLFEPSKLTIYSKMVCHAYIKECTDLHQIKFILQTKKN